jgi:hypothetical protein
VGKLGLVVVAVAAACLLAAGRAASDPVWAGQCGIAAQQTVWGEYGWPTLLPILARPGTLLAVTPGANKGVVDYAVEARKRGAATYAFDLKLTNKVGTPANPADPSTLESGAEKVYLAAVARTGGCTTPLIVENELFGAGTSTPWTTTTAQYRANVLAFLQDLAALGAHPVILINKSPYTGSSDAVAWWLSVSKVADIVREVYIPATKIWPLGPILGNRVLRQSYRNAVAALTSIGLPANRVGIMLSFLSQKGVGGRNGLQPASAWFQVVKWEALSAKEVAAEVGLGSVFSWGWQEWNRKEIDPAKPSAACVWLWARRRTLCNAPKKLGRTFDRSLTDGQIPTGRGTVCRVRRASIGAGAVASLQALTGDRQAALSALFERLVETSERSVSQHAVLAAEHEVVADSFHGSRSAYVAALREAHATVAIARSVLADEIRRARLEQLRYAGQPTTSEVAAFYFAYPSLLVRRVRVSPSPPWLASRQTGYALSEAAPQRLFALATGRKAHVATLLGTYSVKPLGPSQLLGALPLPTVRPAIVAALRGFARAQSFEHWTIAQQNVALGQTICLHDQLPQPAAIDLTQYLPFLRIE